MHSILFSCRSWLARRLLAASQRIAPVSPVEPPAAEVAPEPAPVHPDVEALEDVRRHQQRLAESAQAIASGNLARDVQVGADDDDGLALAFRDMLAGLRKLVGQVKDAAIDVDRGAHEAGSE